MAPSAVRNVQRSLEAARREQAVITALHLLSCTYCATSFQLSKRPPHSLSSLRCYYSTSLLILHLNLGGVPHTVEGVGLQHVTHHQFPPHVMPCGPFTFTMCSLGSRLQSANVISLPSKNLRVETVISSMLFSSISSGRGEFRYSSNFCRVFKRPRSKPEEKKQQTTASKFQSKFSF